MRTETYESCLKPRIFLMMGLTILLKLFCAACKVNVIGFIKTDLNNLQKENHFKKFRG